MGGPAVDIHRVRAHDAPVIAFSDILFADLQELRRFLYANMYRHPDVLEMRKLSAEAVKTLFDHFTTNPQALPDGWITDDVDQSTQARIVGDYIAGMTDRFALKLFSDLTGRSIPG